MKIWRMSAGRDMEYESLYPVDKDDALFIFFEIQKGEKLSGRWKNIAMKLESEGKRRDIIRLGDSSNYIILSEKAMGQLKEFIYEDCEMLPLEYDDNKYYLLNVTNKVDGLDYEKTKFNKWGVVEEYSFLEEKLKGHDIFRVSKKELSLDSYILISDKLRKDIKEMGLKGFDFKLIWDNDEDYVEEENHEVNPFLRIADISDYLKHLSRYYGEFIYEYKDENRDIKSIDLYIAEANDKLNRKTVATFGNSFFRTQIPSSLDNGYVEFVMHLPECWDLGKDVLEDKRYAWIFKLIKDFGENTIRKGYWMRESFVVPNQSEEDFRETYMSLLGRKEFDFNSKVNTYSDSTEYCGVIIVPPIPRISGAFKMEYLEKGEHPEGDWPIYIYTLVPLYREEIIVYFREGYEGLLKKLMKNGIEEIFDFDRKNSCI